MSRTSFRGLLFVGAAAFTAVAVGAGANALSPLPSPRLATAASVQELPVSYRANQPLVGLSAVRERTALTLGGAAAEFSRAAMISRQRDEAVALRATTRERARQRATRAKMRAVLSGPPREVARYLAAQRGWGEGQFACLDSIWTRESNWNYRAFNASSGAYGIPQALPGSKMGAVGGDWTSNPVTQIRWGLSYIASSYGSPCGAWSFWQSHSWY